MSISECLLRLAFTLVALAASMAQFTSSARAEVREFAVMEISIGPISGGTLDLEAPLELQTTSPVSGRLTFQLWPEAAPNAVSNFRYLAESGFYDGTSFHRHIKGFMVQGGDPLTRFPDFASVFGLGNPGYTIPDEGSDDPQYRHVRGVLSMAHSNNPTENRFNTGGSQFFMMFNDAPWLDNVHAAFGTLTDENPNGFLNLIENAGTINAAGTPKRPITVNKVRITRDTSPEKPRIISATYAGKLENPFWRASLGSERIDQKLLSGFSWTLANQQKDFTPPVTLYRQAGEFTVTSLSTGMASGRFSYYGREFPFRVPLKLSTDGVFTYSGSLEATKTGVDSRIVMTIRLQPSIGKQPGTLSMRLAVPYGGAGAYLEVAGASESVALAEPALGDVTFLGYLERPYFYGRDSENKISVQSPPQIDPKNPDATSWYKIGGPGFYSAKTLNRRSAVMVTAFFPGSAPHTFCRPIVNEGQRTLASFFTAELDPTFQRTFLPIPGVGSVPGSRVSTYLSLLEWSELLFIFRKKLLSGEVIPPFSKAVSAQSSWFHAFSPLSNAADSRFPNYPDYFGFTNSYPVQTWLPLRNGQIFPNFPENLGALVITGEENRTLPFRVSKDLRSAFFLQNSGASLRLDPVTGMFSGSILRKYGEGREQRTVSCPLRGILFVNENVSGIGQLSTPDGTEEIYLRAATFSQN